MVWAWEVYWVSLGLGCRQNERSSAQMIMPGPRLTFNAAAPEPHAGDDRQHGRDRVRAHRQIEMAAQVSKNLRDWCGKLFSAFGLHQSRFGRTTKIGSVTIGF